MADSVLMQAVQAMIHVLDTVSVAAGYSNDLALSAGGGGVHWSDSDYSTVTLPMAEVDVINTSKEIDIDRGYSDQYACASRMHVRLKIEIPEDVPAQKAMDCLITDVERILSIERTKSPVLGVPGVDDVLLQGSEVLIPDEDEHDLEAVLLCEIIYQHSVLDPTSPVFEPEIV